MRQMKSGDIYCWQFVALNELFWSKKAEITGEDR